jgi:glucose-6-phosphate 1-dehydrogenase
MAKKPALKPEKLPPRAPDCAMVIFGAQGDLAKRLLVPALYNLADAKLLGRGFRVLGVDHGAGDDAALRKGLGGFLRGLAASKDSEFGAAKIDASAWTWLEDRLFYQLGDFEDDATYTGLAARLADLVGKGASVLFYLAVAPNFFGDVVQRLGKVGLLKEPVGAFRRVVVEKPFGHDLASAKALNKRLLTWLTESQIYRIDHFLGKETVRNIMVTRFGNGVFEPLWNRLNIDSVQITAAETVGVESRGSFYEKTGALRDMVTNHLLQLLGMVAMEAPNSFDADAVRAEKGRVIEAIRHLTPAQAAKDSVRGQYTAGKVLGQKMVGYRQSPKVDPHSDVETFVAVKLEIDNWRWAGVPFYLRTGKAMTAHDTEITIQFKAAPQTLFQDHCVLPSRPNALVLHIQPNEGISLFFDAKRPGPDIDVTGVRMDFRYADFFKVKPATGYETLIYDCLTGDQTLFKRAQDIEYDWAAVMPFLKAWKGGGKVEKYAAGTDGPAAAKAFMARDGRTWKPLGQ